MTNEFLNNYYETHDEHVRFASKHGSVEFLTTMYYIKKYLRPKMRVLEIGAGTGRYSHALAREGYLVDAVELIAHNIEVFKENTLPCESVTITQGNALDLSSFGCDTYDFTLLLGPLYHLYTEEEKLRALEEAIRVTKPGGVVFAAYCMCDATIVEYGFVKENIQMLMEKHMLDPVTFHTFSSPEDIFELVRTEDIDALRARFPVTELHLVATDGFTNHMRETVDAMDDATFAIYLEYHLATCERRDMLGLSNHTLDIFRKE